MVTAVKKNQFEFISALKKVSFFLSLFKKWDGQTKKEGSGNYFK